MKHTHALERALSLLLALVMTVSAVPSYAFAAGSSAANSDSISIIAQPGDEPDEDELPADKPVKPTKEPGPAPLPGLDEDELPPDTMGLTVEELIARIDLLGRITEQSATELRYLRASYEKLTDEEKAAVTNYQKLVDAEAALEELLAPPTFEEIYQTTADFLKKTVTDPMVSSIGGEWAVLGLARSAWPAAAEFNQKYYSNLSKTLTENNGVLHDRKYTEYSRVVLALTAAGYDPTDVAGYNVLAPLADYDKVVWQGVNGPIWALIALDSHAYPVPKAEEGRTQTSRENLVAFILDKELEAGGWALSGTETDPDLTAMAILSLVPYQADETVKAAVDRAVAALSAVQNANGSFSSWGTVNCESIAQTIVALTAAGIDPDTDERFIKNGTSALAAMNSFYVEGGGFRHVAEGEVSGMASEQAFYALAAYDRFKKGGAALFTMSDVQIEAAYQKVIDRIAAIGEVSLASEPAILAARSAYDALPEFQKVMIENYDLLPQAEAALEALHNAWRTSFEQTGGKLMETIQPEFGWEWQIIGLARAGQPLEEGFVTAYVENIRAALAAGDVITSSTDYSKIILALTALGQDVADLGGINLLTALSDMEGMQAQGINALVYGLLALDSHDYLIPLAAEGKTQTTREGLIDAILAKAVEAGGWAFFGDETDPDMTAMAVQALAPYYAEREDVKAAVDKAMTQLSAMQNDEAGYTSWGSDNSSSVAQVMLAQLALGRDPRTDKTLSKNYVTTVDSLLRFAVEGGGFKWVLADEEINGMATEQAYYVLAAYDRFLTEKTFLYDMSELEIPVPYLEVIGLIDQIGEVNLESGEAVQTAWNAYSALSDGHKQMVVNAPKLNAAKARLEELRWRKAYQATAAKIFETIQLRHGWEWQIIGLARSGYPVPENFYAPYMEDIKAVLAANEGRLENPTDYEKVILALTAIGENVSNVGGYDLLAPLADLDYVQSQGINSLVYALIAFDSHHYEIPQAGEGRTQTTREELIRLILAAQVEGGGWTFFGEEADPDMTGMAVQALAPYYAEREDVKAAVDSAMAVLSAMQNEKGGYTSWGSDNSNSLAQVITAQIALGRDPAKDTAFIKNGVSTVQSLLRFAVEGGGFKWLEENPDSDGMGTEQAYYALAAYDRMLTGRSFLYDMMDIHHAHHQAYDETGHWIACSCGEKLHFEPHSLVMNQDYAGHWYECTLCGYQQAKVPHSYTLVVDKAATFNETGLAHEECTICGTHGLESILAKKERPIQGPLEIDPNTLKPTDPDRDQMKDEKIVVTIAPSGRTQVGELAASMKENALAAAVHEAVRNMTLTGQGIQAELQKLADANVLTQFEALSALKGAGISTVDKDVRVMNQFFVRVDDVAISKEGAEYSTFTVSLTPMMRTIVTVAAEGEEMLLEGEGRNSIIMGKEKEMQVGESTTVTLPLPKGFVPTGTALYAAVGDYMYTTQLNGAVLSFADPQGAGDFTITSQAPGAQIGTQYYIDLEAAVRHVEDGQTILMTADGPKEPVPVDREVSFFLNTGDHSFYGFEAAEGYTGTENDGSYTFTRSAEATEQPADAEESSGMSVGMVVLIFVLLAVAGGGTAAFLAMRRNKNSDDEE